MPTKKAKKSALKKPTKQPAAKAAVKAQVAKSRSAGSIRPKKLRSIDEVINKYEKERTALKASLAETKKKVIELELRRQKLQDEIDSVRNREEDISLKVSEVDQRRDREVADLLAKLGVQISETNHSHSGYAPVESESISHGNHQSSDGDDDDLEDESHESECEDKV